MRVEIMVGANGGNATRVRVDDVLPVGEARRATDGTRDARGPLPAKEQVRAIVETTAYCATASPGPAWA